MFYLLISLSSYSAVNVSNTPSVGDWTDNVDAAIQMGDKQHIPIVMILSKSDLLCNLCANFNRTIFQKADFQDHIKKRGYIGVKVTGKTGDFSEYNKLRTYVKGFGTLPGISLYWRKADGSFLDPTEISIHANYHNSVQWFVNWMEGYLSGYDKSGSTPSTYHIVTMTNITATILSQNVSVSHPGWVTEGESSYIQFSRNGDTGNPLTIHVLTNGVWLADVNWRTSDTAVKQIPIKVERTDEFDHGRPVTVTIRVLDSSVDAIH